MSTIYVSPSGNDANDGHSPEFAVASIKRGTALIGNKSSDQLLFQRGGVWPFGFYDFSKSGASPGCPIVIGAYGEGPRPMFQPTTYSGFFHVAAEPLANVTLDGLAFDAFDLPRDGFNRSGVQVHNGTNIAIRNCHIRGWANNIIVQSCKGVTVMDCEVLNAYAVGRHSQGLFANAVDDLTIGGCTFDHNGWHPTVATAEPEKNHNVYVTATCGPAYIVDNTFARAAATGVQARSGGEVRGNRFIANPIALTFGLVYGSDPKPGGVSGWIDGNTILDAGDMPDGNIRRIGIQIANVNDAGVIVQGNHIGPAIGPGGSAFQIHCGNGMGVRKIDLIGNTAWADIGLSFNSDLRGAAIAEPFIGPTTIGGNVWKCPTRCYSFWEAGAGYDFDPKKFTFARNVHASPIAVQFSRLWGDRRRLVLDEAGWRALTGDESRVLT